MNRTTMIGLAGHAEPFRLDTAADARLSDYLDRAAVRLRNDPDRFEVLDDLERSIGDRLNALTGVSGRVVTAADIDGILLAIGAVDAGHGPALDEAEAPRRRRRLVRIKDGQEVAGVCTGIAAYADVNVDWVRTVVILGTLVTGGILGVVYIALVLILPVEPRAGDLGA